MISHLSLNHLSIVENAQGNWEIDDGRGAHMTAPPMNEHHFKLWFYELYGEKLVAAGRYEKVIRYREHMLPLARAIRATTEREELCVRYAS